MNNLPRILILLVSVAAGAVLADDLDAARTAELERLLTQDCGSCHGLTMKGGLGSPLNPPDIADKSDATLVSTILHGRPGTAMPPWQPLLSETEARWIVTRLRAGGNTQ